ncbi:orotidine-5'-phosphate decarboxylase [Nitrosomonas sp. Nm166]|uniref:orotidine-5'-phosphate decarboxylase n=1 Tax=Nitrosomonas sp. Nm166 TaxID=1881054 RepID=UPI0008DF06C5|nr:orotidine-5'-phosphate decarboxylase [Nitrosomonas sp. Nm166]SFE93674.1 orotidine-5'-phosphate decarboxylase [Nitrosomonas sp. Nm166]
MNDPRVIVALDFSRAADALNLADRLAPQVCRLKVGKELFTAAGPQLVEKLMLKGFDIFLDLKYHDIPNTVANACKAAASLGVWMMNVHALGGRKMLMAAREAIPSGSTKLIAVTLLTSMDQDDLADIGLQGQPEEIVERLARLADDCALDGVVCSALETAHLRQLVGDHFILVTPGIRLAGGQADDQKRITTPRQAIQNGSSYLVIGRPITQADDPFLICQRLSEEIS